MSRVERLWEKVDYAQIQPVDWFSLEELTEELLLKMAFGTPIGKVWALLYWRTER